jgi:hypothetical protein
MFRGAHRSSSGAPNYFQPLVYIPVPTQPGKRPVTTWVYKPEAENTVWSSWWWAVGRSKRVEPSINFGIINSITGLHLVGYFYWFILRCTDPRILNLEVLSLHLHGSTDEYRTHISRMASLRCEIWIQDLWNTKHGATKSTTKFDSIVRIASSVTKERVCVEETCRNDWRNQIKRAWGGEKYNNSIFHL